MKCKNCGSGLMANNECCVCGEKQDELKSIEKRTLKCAIVATGEGEKNG